jgi:hypothetical protein
MAFFWRCNTWLFFSFSVQMQKLLAGLLLYGPLCAQPNPLVAGLLAGEQVPDKLLAGKSVVIFHPQVDQPALRETQTAFQAIGIDAVAYYPSDWVLANEDVARAFAGGWAARGISFLICMEKNPAGYEFYFMPFNGKPTLVEKDQPAWRVAHPILNELLLTVYRSAWAVQKKENNLINSVPETGAIPDFVEGRRLEIFATDVRIDPLAVPLTNDSTLNRQLRRFFQEQYPFRYQFVRLPDNERDLRRQGFQLILKHVYGRGIALRQVLLYSATGQETSYASTVFPNGLSQIKTIPADRPVYKFYIKQIEAGNVYLGPRWDADEDMLSALRNHIKGLKAELRVE